jgi:hypothetical protein
MCVRLSLYGNFDGRKIMTSYPKGKVGVNSSNAKYNIVRAAILSAITDEGEIAFGDLPTAVEARLAKPFDGSLNWYVTTVKRDLEARKEIERIPDKSPQHLRLVV